MVQKLTERNIISIKNKDDKREINQLWFSVLYYFELAKEVKEELQEKEPQGLNTTIQNIADNYLKLSDFIGTKKQIMLLNAHLASCAVRLYSIDELLGKKYTSTRWYLYNGLIKIKESLKEDDIIKNGDKISHILLRMGIAHKETDDPSPKTHKDVEIAFRKFTIGELYKNIESIKKEIQKELSPFIE